MRYIPIFIFVCFILNSCASIGTKKDATNYISIEDKDGLVFKEEFRFKDNDIKEIELFDAEGPYAKMIFANTKNRIQVKNNLSSGKVQTIFWDLNDKKTWIEENCEKYDMTSSDGYLNMLSDDIMTNTDVKIGKVSIKYDTKLQKIIAILFLEKGFEVKNRNQNGLSSSLFDTDRNISYNLHYQFEIAGFFISKI